MSLETSVSERGEKEVRDCVFVVMKLLLVCGVRNWSLMVFVLFVKKVAKSSAVRVDEGGGGGGQRREENVLKSAREWLFSHSERKQVASLSVFLAQLEMWSVHSVQT